MATFISLHPNDASNAHLDKTYPNIRLITKSSYIPSFLRGLERSQLNNNNHIYKLYNNDDYDFILTLKLSLDKMIVWNCSTLKKFYDLNRIATALFHICYNCVVSTKYGYVMIPPIKPFDLYNYDTSQSTRFAIPLSVNHLNEIFKDTCIQYELIEDYGTSSEIEMRSSERINCHPIFLNLLMSNISIVSK